MDAEKKLTVRIIASVAIFLIFTVLAVSAALTHALDAQAPYIFALLFAAMLIMPRQLTQPEAATPAQRARLHRVRLWLAYARAGYFLTALLVLFGLPRLIG